MRNLSTGPCKSSSVSYLSTVLDAYNYTLYTSESDPHSYEVTEAVTNKAPKNL